MTRRVKREARENRRERIAAAALDVLATEGARGLTHRAVDESARLPLGSTSYYYRTRHELIDAAAALLCERDERDVREAFQLDGVTSLLERWASRSHRRRLVARFELFLDATRNPKTRTLLRRQRSGFLRAAERAFANAGAKDPALRGELLVATIDGVLLSHLFDPRASFDELRRVISRELAAARPRRATKLRR